MILYVTLGTNDVQHAKSFYDPVLATVDMVRSMEDDQEIGYGEKTPPKTGRQRTLFITKPYLKAPASWGNGTMLALFAPSRSAVDAFHQATLANGGTDEGAPGLRPDHANFYACYVRDPDGNKLSAVCETQE